MKKRERREIIESSIINLVAAVRYCVMNENGTAIWAKGLMLDRKTRITVIVEKIRGKQFRNVIGFSDRRFVARKLNRGDA